MWSLILKDLRATKKIILFMFIYVIVNAIVVYPVSDARGYMLTCFMIATFLIIYVHGYEEMKRGALLSCSLPVTRTRIIIAKYITSFIMVILVMAVYLISTIIFEPFLTNTIFSPLELLKTGNLIALTAGSSFIMAVFFPLFFRFGAYMGGFISGFVCIGYFFVFSIYYKFSDLSFLHILRKINEPGYGSELPGIYIVLIISSIILVSISGQAAVKVFKNKDI